MNRSFKWAAIAAILGSLGGALLTTSSWADGIPETAALSYSGRLEAADGEPMTGEHNIEVRFWDSASGGTSSLCTSDSHPVTLEQGRFDVQLPDTCTDAVSANPDVWVEVLVNGGSLGRVKAGAVPYAVESSHSTTADLAGSADTLGTLTPELLQRRVTGACSEGQSIRSIAEDGTTTCEPDNDTTYTGATGVNVSGTTISADETYLQRRAAGMSTTCNGANQSIKTIAANGAVTCETDDNSTYAGSSSVTVSGTTISLASNGVNASHMASSAIRRRHLAGTEIAVYQQAEGCGGGLTTSTSCTTVACGLNGSVPTYRECSGTCSSLPGPLPCPGLTQVGWLIDDAMPDN